MVKLCALALVAATLGGCLRSTKFSCTRDSDCTTGGTCEPVGFCSFPDSSCSGGSRFGELSGQYANQCVGDIGPDAGVDAIDAPLTCSAAYVPLAGAPHKYHAIMNATNWQAQRDACASDGGYLAIPDDIGELTAIMTLNGANEIWVGITDAATENTFLTVLGAPQTFLPWDVGQPNNTNNSDCVRAKPNLKLNDDRCISSVRAVCECE